MEKRIIATTVVLICLVSAWMYTSNDDLVSDIPESYSIEEFPLFAQPDGISCGPTSLQMVLAFYKKNTTLEDVKKEAYTTWFTWGESPIGMTSPDNLARAATRLSLSSNMRSRSSIDHLKNYIYQKRPTLVLLRSGEKLWHWVVVVGYGEDYIELADPSGGKRYTMPLDTFLGAWSFSHDMYGTEYSKKCPFCENGHYWNLSWLGPFDKCDQCGGKGSVSDFYSHFLEWADVYGNTLIVPVLPIS